MSSHSRTAEREEERRLNTRTLAIASAASAAAALLTSQLSTAGTWVAAAMTPVIVSLVSEMLQRPTDRLAKSFAGRPAPRGADTLAPRAPMDPSAGPGRPGPSVRDLGSEAPIRVYRVGESTARSSRRTRARTGGSMAPGAREAGAGGRDAGGRGGAGAADRGPGRSGSLLGSPGVPPAGKTPVRRRRKIAFGAVFATAGIAFLIAVAALTLPELVAGGSVGKSDGRTTLFGGKKSNDTSNEQAPQNTTEEEQPTTPEEEQQPTTPEQQIAPQTEQAPPAEQTTPQQAPAPGEPLPQTTPLPPPTTQP
jgi:hypothetical protein